MRLCTFEVDSILGRHARLGARTPHGIIDLNFACAWHLEARGEPRPYSLADVLVPPAMLEFLQGQETSMGFARATASAVLQSLESDTGPPQGLNGERLLHAPGDVRLRAPLQRPLSMRDFFAFEQHVKAGFEKRGEAMPPEWYEMPVYYKGNHLSIIGPEDEAPWPSFTGLFDYELEIAAVIGKTCRNVSAKSARDAIAGVTIMNDFSARDIQRKEMRVRLGPAKGKDWCTSIGPELVTLDEIDDLYALEMTARINGEEWSRGSTGSMHWRFEQMIEFLSKDDTLHPGELIGSGTVGSGCGLELDRWVKPGDVIELEIEKIGVLRNTVGQRTSTPR
jgi:2-keto-4-pentenoate hydratase/2-oxohepta-3-ene-1,7-dioic acid hydratase in catechol pathway